MKDQNTKFFHAAALFRKKKQEISRIKINGREVGGTQNLKEKVRDYFLNRYAQVTTPKFDFNMDNHPKISQVQA